MDKKHNISNIRILIQSILISIISGLFITLAVFYSILGMCPKCLDITDFITKLPLYPVDIVGKICCSFSIIEKENEIPFLRIGYNMVFIWIVSCIIFYIYKPKIYTPTLILKSCLVGVIIVLLIDFISYPNIPLGIILILLMILLILKIDSKLVKLMK